MQSKASTVNDYIAELPDDRRVTIEGLRKVFKKNLDKRFKEGMQYGMIGYFIPHSIYPAGYHCDPRQPLPFAGLASQKNHIGIYLMCVYMDEKLSAQFESAWKKTGKKLDMGKACIRCKNLDGVALDVLGDTIRSVSVDDYIARYESNLASSAKRKSKSASGSKKPATRKTPAKKAAAKKSPSKKKSKAK
ncbi:MAG: DUF1801 domain-containing protein [Phycisphaerales bacterium]|nr:DUF1801 domain-containing protein [Phycisphaerales bacterium]MCB9857262.1 DUF1801 domain-containing protein [Phycisphaerales bacterium]MCB9863024.1 DUF1801 domain-containing protein [Phycisphaerales bacterium]